MAKVTLYMKTVSGKPFSYTFDNETHSVHSSLESFPYEITIRNRETGLIDGKFVVASFLNETIRKDFTEGYAPPEDTVYKSGWFTGGNTTSEVGSATWSWTTTVYPDGTVVYNALSY